MDAPLGRSIQRQVELARLDQAIDEAIPAPLPTLDKRRRIRIKSGLSESGEAALVGTTAASISRWETGRREPRGELRRRYADVLALLQDRLAEVAD